MPELSKRSADIAAIIVPLELAQAIDARTAGSSSYASVEGFAGKTVTDMLLELAWGARQRAENTAKLETMTRERGEALASAEASKRKLNEAKRTFRGAIALLEETDEG